MTNMIVEYLRRPPPGTWFVFDVMRKGEWPVRRGRPRNEWCAALIDSDPDDFMEGRKPKGCCWLDLGRHKTVEQAWDHAESLVATRH
jgi:hypothetical protein